MEVPYKVKRKAQSLINEYGGEVEYLGKYMGYDAFTYGADVEADIVELYLWDGEKVVDTIDGMLAVDIISALVDHEEPPIKLME